MNTEIDKERIEERPKKVEKKEPIRKKEWIIPAAE